MENLNLIQGDCLEWLENADCRVDHVIADLPYYNVSGDAFDRQWRDLNEYLAWVQRIVICCRNLLKDGSNLLLFCSRQNMWRIGRLLYQEGFVENRTIIWARRRGFNSTRGRALASGYEPILFWSKGDSAVFNPVKIKSDSRRKEYTQGTLRDGVSLSDVWTDIPALPHNAKEKTAHPTQKPEALMRRLVEVFTDPEDLVLDFCMGSGTTGVACKALGRKFIGIEKNPDYFTIAKKRLQDG